MTQLFAPARQNHLAAAESTAVEFLERCKMTSVRGRQRKDQCWSMRSFWEAASIHLQKICIAPAVVLHVSLTGFAVRLRLDESTSDVEYHGTVALWWYFGVFSSRFVVLWGSKWGQFTFNFANLLHSTSRSFPRRSEVWS